MLVEWLKNKLYEAMGEDAACHGRILATVRCCRKFVPFLFPKFTAFGRLGSVAMGLRPELWLPLWAPDVCQRSESQHVRVIANLALLRLGESSLFGKLVACLRAPNVKRANDAA